MPERSGKMSAVRRNIEFIVWSVRGLKKLCVFLWRSVHLPSVHPFPNQRVARPWSRSGESLVVVLVHRYYARWLEAAGQALQAALAGLSTEPAAAESGDAVETVSVTVVRPRVRGFAYQP